MGPSFGEAYWLAIQATSFFFSLEWLKTGLES